MRLVLASLVLLMPGVAWAQNTTKLCIPIVQTGGVNGCFDISASNPLPVNATFSGTVNVGAVDGSAFTPGTTTTPNGGFYQTTVTSNPLTTGQFGAQQLTQYRAGMVNLRNSSGVEVGTSSTPLQVSVANTGANSTALLVTTSIGEVTPTALDVDTVTTGGTAVNALSAGHRVHGGWIQNPVGASAPLCINEIGTATGTVSLGNTTCIAAGQSYNIAAGSGAVSVISSDSSHTFSGMGWN